MLAPGRLARDDRLALAREYWGRGYATEARKPSWPTPSPVWAKPLDQLIQPENGPSSRRPAPGMQESSTEIMGHPALVYGIERTMVPTANRLMTRNPLGCSSLKNTIFHNRPTVII
jgi:hypothetical protein